MIWLDVLDLPLFVYLEGSYAVEGKLQDRANRPDASLVEYSQAGLVPARALGASLLVAVNSDASARGLGKGNDRPVNALEDRLAVIAALEPVSLVTWFEEDTPLKLILAAKPEVLVKGGDWKPEMIVGAREVKSWGGTVCSIAFAHQRSTTALLARIRSNKKA